MHGVRRIRTTAEQREQRRKREAVEIAKFRKLDEAVLQSKTDKDALNRTTQLLSLNPEHYTAWNIRRELITAMTSQEQKVATLTYDVQFTESLLPTHPKVYWLWNHRRWVLLQLTAEQPEDVKKLWLRELALVNKLLERDPRNFHGWAYRRWIVETSEGTSSTTEEEFAFTTKKINENFSNYSAWHYRAQLIPQLKDKPSLTSELDYVYGAVAMDPQDQSGWLYYQWLLKSPLFESELTSDLLLKQRTLVAELWDEEQSVWAGRLLCEIAKMQGHAVDREIVRQLAELDPLRSNRYKELLQGAT